jgi:hypothetical protein
MKPTFKSQRPRAAACAGFFFVACVLAAGASFGGRAGARQGDKPVEQVRKNIQVIKGLPDSQILPLMNFVSTSLGVRCNHCHVIREKAGGERDWLMELDDKPTKQTARQMMRMVMALNKDHGADFRGGAVTCFTCHRGQTKPVSFPSLPLAASAHEGGEGAGAPTAAAPLPTVAQVFERYVEGVGGREAIARLKTRLMKGTREASQGRSWPLEVTAREPEQFVMAVSIPEQGTFTQAFDGAAGWVKNPRVTRALSAAELADLRRVGRLFQTLKVSGPTPTMRVAGREKIGDRDAIVVEDGPAPAVRERLFFDAQTGRLLRQQIFSDAVLFPIQEQTDFEDYRAVDGVLLPFVIRTSNVDTWFSVTRRFTEIRHNAPVEDSVFKMPAAPRD